MSCNRPCRWLLCNQTQQFVGEFPGTSRRRTCLSVLYLLLVPPPPPLSVKSARGDTFKMHHINTEILEQLHHQRKSGAVSGEWHRASARLTSRIRSESRTRRDPSIVLRSFTGTFREFIFLDAIAAFSEETVSFFFSFSFSFHPHKGPNCCLDVYRCTASGEGGERGGGIGGGGCNSGKLDGVFLYVFLRHSPP